MSWSVDFLPVLPLWLIALLGAAGLALIAIAAQRRLAAAWLRAIAVAALTLALANPVVVREERRNLPTTVALVVDRSASQSFEDRTAEADRAADAVADEIGAIDGVDLRVVEAEQGAASDGTELFAAANDALADVAPGQVGAVIMVTDGQVHDVPANAGALGGAPLHALVTGREGEIDRRIEIESAPRYGVVGERQTITYRVADEGVPAGTPVEVEIRRDGEPVAVESAVAGESEDYNFIVPHGGEIVFEFAATALEGELTEINNGAVVTLEGVRENLRVLLVSGEPHAGERVWRDLLKSDTSVDLIHFTILRPPDKIDFTPPEEMALIAFPTRELFSEKLDEFDLVIFDRYQEQGTLPSIYFDNIVRYVRNGGAFLMAAGPDNAGFLSVYSTSLATILPATPTGETTETPFRPLVSEAGFRHPVTRDLEGAEADPPAWSRWFRIVDAADPTGDVVMNGPDGRPLLVLGHEQEGRVAMLLSDQAWLWARDYEGGGPYLDLLRRVAHWLMREPDLDEEALRATAEDGTLTIERQTMGDEVGPVLVRSPLGEERQVTLEPVSNGLWRAEVDAGEVGLWRLEQGDRVAVVHVGPPNPREYVDPTSTAEVLRPLVEDTGGHIGRAGAGDPIPSVVPVTSGDRYGAGGRIGIRMTEASLLTGVDRTPLLAGLLGLAILAGLLAATWFREGRR